ncbi:MAG: hypothetical protein OER88_07965 [Planctomycetota bacterium]|nr:hypothetical protein [Planctomycetota bacterium]
MSRRFHAFLLFALLFALPVAAAGPVDGELTLYWWQTDFTRDTDFGDVDTDNGQPGFQGQLWFGNKVGVRASLFSADLEDLNEDDAEFRSADILVRVISRADNTYLALGAGYEDAEFSESDGVLTPVKVEATGIRATAAARVGLVGVVQAFGHYTELIDVDDFTEPGGDVYDDMDGREYEFGVVWDAAPFVDIRAGYRVVKFDYRRTPLVGTPYGGEIKTEGFFAGVGVHF